MTIYLFTCHVSFWAK